MPKSYFVEAMGNRLEIVQDDDGKFLVPEGMRGLGGALKPAFEPALLFRKPLVGTVAENVLAHGTGGLNIDGCRVGTEPPAPRNAPKKIMRGGKFHAAADAETEMSHYNPTLGRWPANVIHSGEPEVVSLFPEQTSGSRSAGVRKGMGFHGANGDGGPAIAGSSGSAARFFYCAKASKRDRNEGCENIAPKQYSHDGRETPIDNAYQRNSSSSSNSHPTVKPTDLMAYLCRLVTPPGGIVLDPFMGSGSTGKAAIREGFRFIGIEREESYFAIAKSRIGFEEKSVESTSKASSDKRNLELFA